MNKMETSSYDPKQYFLAFAYGCAYLCFSATTVISNKHLIMNTNFHSAIFVSSLGSWFGWFVSLAMVFSGKTKLEHNFSMKEWATAVLPIGLATAFSLAAANMAYFYLSLAFIQVLKAFAPVITFGVLIMFGLDRYNVKILGSLCVIVCGSLIACYGELHFTALGLMCMFVAEVSEALRSVGIQLLLVNRKMGLIEGMFYFCPATLVFLTIFTAILEGDKLFNAEHIQVVHEYWYLFCISACLGFLVTLSGLGVVQNAGATLFKAMSQIKNACIILFAVIFYGEQLTWMEVGGYGIAIVGFVLFNIAKNKDIEEVRAEQGMRDATLVTSNDTTTTPLLGDPQSNSLKKKGSFLARMGSFGNQSSPRAGARNSRSDSDEREQ
jgi:drug/metabolite transporter (DMT)-like permease